MAALVLGAAGAVVGSFFGPLGASVGWALGSALGNALDPEKIQGPRLTDLKLSGSQYGQMIPIVLGRKRIAGNIVWKTDLVEHSDTSDGKGGPEVTTYSYTVSFAVQLCEGPITGVPRIWADGRLVHDNTVYTSQTSFPFELYLGTETQLPDPTMEAVLGVGNVPAYRGTALIVFTDMPVGDYGNRIPNLEFDVLTVGPVSVAAHIVAENNDIGQLWNNSGPGAGGIGFPYINSWDASDGDKIVVQNMGSAPSHEYDSTTLTHIGTVAYLGPGSLPPNLHVEGPAPSLIWNYLSVGTHIFNGAEVQIYLYPSFSVQNAPTNPAMAGNSVWSIDGANTVTDMELAASAGIPTAVFISSVVFTQDKTAMFVFTSPAYLGAADAWYCYENGVIVDSGTVSAVAFPGISGLGFGSWGSLTFLAAMFENNRRFMWRMEGAPDPGRFRVYEIDDAGEFNHSATAGFVDSQETEDFTFPSVYIFKEGFCGAILNDTLVIASRFPQFSPTGPTYEAAVTALSVRAGLDPSQVIATSLADDYLDGYVIAQQNTVRSAIGQLQASGFFDVVESDLSIKCVKRGSESVVTIPDDDLAAHVYGSTPPALVETVRTQEQDLPRVVNVTFFDPDFDDLQGTQSARREVTNSETEHTIGLAIVMPTKKARQIADVMLYNSWIERDRYTIRLSRKYAHLEPTDVITVGNRVMRLTSKEESAQGVITFEGVATQPLLWVSGPSPAPGSGFVPGLPPVAQATDLLLLDIPLLQDSNQALGFYDAMNGRSSPRWRGATLFKSSDNGVSYASQGSNSIAGTFGFTTTILGDFAGGNTFDEVSSVTVFLGPGSSALSSSTEALVLSGANQALIGREIIRFKTATLTVPQTYVLTGLLRGRRGTEWATAEHATLERFVLLSTVQDQPMGAAEIGALRLFKAVSLGDALADADVVPFVCYAVRNKPFSPVHVGGGHDAAGNVTINWTRRTRIGGAWIDGSDVPLGEVAEGYVIEIWNAAYTVCARVIAGIASPTYQYTSAMQVTDFGANQLNVFIRVGQLGMYGLGYQASASIPGAGASNTAPLNPVDPYQGPVVPPSGGTVDELIMDAFASLFDAGDRDRQLAYKMTELGPLANIGWYSRKQFEIVARFFHGDGQGWALWAQDSTYSAPFDGDASTPRYPNEFTYVMGLAVAATT